jgi:hypothetical protein
MAGLRMAALLATCALAHAAASGACAPSVPVAQLALVRAGILHPFDLLRMAKKKSRLGRTATRGVDRKEGRARDAGQLAARDRRASLEPVDAPRGRRRPLRGGALVKQGHLRQARSSAR